jgi:flagellar protein FlgJ
MLDDKSTQLASVYTDFSGLNKLHTEAAKQTDAAKRETAKQFESLFLQMMIKSMREAGGKGLLDSDQTEMARDMYDQQLAVSLSEKGSIGIADMVMRQLGVGDTATDGQTPTAASGNRLHFAENLWGNSPQSPVTGKEPPLTWDTPEQFIKQLYPAAQKAAESLGTQPEAVLAIAALETGWGKHVMNDHNGQSSNNLFGVKASHKWDKGITRATTLEYEDGVMQRKIEPFRTYQSPQESVRDFAEFIQRNPRYREALENAADPESFLSHIHKAGYATDPQYVEKVTAVMKKVAQLTKETS